MAVYSLAGRNLKLDTAADVQQYADELAELSDVAEIHLGGNTIGVGAAEALAMVIGTKKTLKVCTFKSCTLAKCLLISYYSGRRLFRHLHRATYHGDT